ncbi:heme-binding protein [Thermodesulfobacteriota bacterium]
MKSGNYLKWKRPLLAAGLSAICFSFLTTGCTFFGIRTSEEASYNVIDKGDQIEIRDYEELVVVETYVNADYDEAGNIAFKKLFAYISGENISKTKIAMTAPVMSKEGDAPAGDKIPMTSPVLGQRQAKGWRYSFVLPTGYTLEAAPLPSDPEVKLAVIPRKKVAVIRYSGSWKEQTMREKSEKLVEWIQTNGLERLSSPRSARYDPPWTLPFLRRNEIMIDVN